MASGRLISALLPLTAALGTACGSGPLQPDSGSLRIVAVTTGSSFDADGYGITVDGSYRGNVLANGATVLAVAPGTHAVSLSGVAANCTLEGNAAQQVSIQIGIVPTAQFSVTCAPAGTLVVSTVWHGFIADSNGYRLVVDDQEPQLIGVEARRTLALPPGNHVVQLSDVASYCHIDGGSTRQVATAVGDTSTVTFSASCFVGIPLAGSFVRPQARRDLLEERRQLQAQLVLQRGFVEL